MRSEVGGRWQSASVASGYEAERFQSFLGKVFHWSQCRALRRSICMIHQDSVVVDVPCGTGRMLPILAAAGLRLLACDVSPAMLAQALERNRGAKGIEYLLGDATSLPLESASVDGIVSVRFVMHLTSDERGTLLREFARVTRRWVIVEYSRDSVWHRWRGRFRGLILQLLKRPRLYPASASADQIRCEAVGAGLTIRKWAWTLRGLSQSVFVVMEKAGPCPDGLPGKHDPGVEP